MNQFGNNVYENFYPRALELYGWNSNLPFLSEVIRDNKPLTVIEVGTWKGYSAITMANEMKKNNIAGKIYCVDTWLGSVDFWYDSNKEFDLKLINGYPSVYYNFLSNVVHYQLTDIIVPVPMCSNQAYKVFRNKLKKKADVIYVDGSHEKEDVYNDLKNYSTILENNGVIFGDDVNYPQVKEAVNEYCLENKITYTVKDNNFWVIRNY